MAAAGGCFLRAAAGKPCLITYTAFWKREDLGRSRPQLSVWSPRGSVFRVPVPGGEGGEQEQQDSPKALKMLF